MAFVFVVNPAGMAAWARRLKQLKRLFIHTDHGFILIVGALITFEYVFHALTIFFRQFWDAPLFLFFHGLIFCDFKTP